MSLPLILVSLLLSGTKAVPRPVCQSIDAGFNVNLVSERAVELSTHSWEFGTASEALLELYNPEFSVFGANPFPGDKLPTPNADIASLAFAQQHICTDCPILVDGDGAVGDPASLGVSALLLGQTDQTYFEAAQREYDFVVNVAPRAWNGAISHRDDVPDLWADFVYMAPPFLAYNAVALNNEDILRDAIQQCGLYRQILLDNNTEPYHGLWEHIKGVGTNDPGLWSTGNGWAAGGMARVYAVTTKWGPSSQWTDELALLASYIKEILDGAMNVPTQSGLLYNYLNDTTWFGEISGTAMLSATAYRMAVLAPETFGASYISWADANRQTIASHVSANGTISPAVNPLDWGSYTPWTAGSPEGQSFGVFLYTSYRDCVAAHVCT